MSYSYLEVMVGDSTYHGDRPLTYSYSKSIPIGSIVRVQLKNKNVLGIVVAITKKPRFNVKPIQDYPNLPTLPKELLDLLNWMTAYYPAPLGVITGLFLPVDLPKTIAPYSEPTHERVSAGLPKLTDEQSEALLKLSGPGLHILHGETGSGKTRVYLELARKTITKNKSCIILTPEIGLTSQITNRFKEVFGEQVILLHSQMTNSARYKLWLSILRSEKPLVIIGPRSALFSPAKNLGLIVLDESHEPAYKQDRAPYYHASFVAAKLAQLYEATLILGSATPLVSDYALAEARGRPIVRMSQKAAAQNTESTTDIQIVDLRQRENFKKNNFLSNTLITEIDKTLERGAQILLFLNRRGTARVVFCEKCGWQALCPHCDLPLVYHGDGHYMRCHTCALQDTSPLSCPECKNTTIVFRGIGTKAVAEELKKMYPGKKIQRFDTDNKKDERLEEHFESIQSGNIDIIVGTQTIAKGIDLPNLELVGVIMADSGLSFPDFSAQERNYQLLHQVIGRVGRGHRKGIAVIQTYNPESDILKRVLHKDWLGFSRKELLERKTYKFPPYYFLLKLTCRRTSNKAAETASNSLAEKITQHGLDVIIEGPAPSFYEKVQGKYQWQLIIKSARRNELLKIIKILPSQWSYDIDPLNLL